MHVFCGSATGRKIVAFSPRSNRHRMGSLRSTVRPPFASHGAVSVFSPIVGAPMPASDIVIKGAREHNLRERRPRPAAQPADLPDRRVSGSGKSSLAFDTLYAEGQRRYVESLSSFARQFLGQMPKPDVDYISGLCPSISISQKSSGNNPRSTVGTITEIYDLPPRAVRPRRPGALPAVRPADHRPDARADHRPDPGAAGEDAVRRARAARSAGRRASTSDLFEDLLKQGFVRARVDGTVVSAHRRPVARPPDAAQHRGRHRPARRPGRRSAARLAEAVEHGAEAGRREA